MEATLSPQGGCYDLKCLVAIAQVSFWRQRPGATRYSSEWGVCVSALGPPFSTPPLAFRTAWCKHLVPEYEHGCEICRKKLILLVDWG